MGSKTVIIRHATRDDAAAIAEIYNEAVINTVAIWNDDTVSAENRIAWMEAHWDKGYPVFVATLDDEVAGYATFSDFRDFDGFQYTVENSIYVHPNFQGRGIGGALLNKTINAAREAGKHVLVAAIEGSNEGSTALHKKYGFQRVGLLPQVGTKNGRWLDMLLMQVMLTDGQPPARPRA